MLKTGIRRTCIFGTNTPRSAGICPTGPPCSTAGRRELLDHVIVLNEPHLRRLLHEYLDYYHNDRTHLSLGKDPPATRAVCAPTSPCVTVASLPRVGGLHHRYEWREAA